MYVMIFNFMFCGTDQDPAMALAISRVFKKTQHRLCRWHMLNKYRNELKKLYKLHEGLKIKLLTVMNHPLTPVEFEATKIHIIDSGTLAHGKEINK